MNKLVLSRFFGRGGLLMKKHSPQVLLFLGISGMVGATVIACRATLKVDAVLTKATEDNEKIETVYADRKDYVNAVGELRYSEEDYNHDKRIVKVQTTFSIAKLYGPAIGLGLASMALILGSQKIMSTRNAALAMAFKTVDGAFKDYRQRLIGDLGIEKDRQYRFGTVKEEYTEEVTDEKGKVKTLTKERDVFDPEMGSKYARFFEAGNIYWNKTPGYNLMYLRGAQSMCNDRLKTRGHVFLNEVYEMIGIPHSQEGAVVGWVRDGDGDGRIDFGVYDITKKTSMDFVNGWADAILLDFNVDGYIQDLI